MMCNIKSKLNCLKKGQLYNFYLKFRGKLLFKRKQKQLHKFGLELLSNFDRVCQENGAICWLVFGTLLGSYREKGFISHDFDLDVSIMKDSYTDELINILSENGFTLDHEFYLVNRETGERLLTEVTFKYKGFPLDVFLSYDKGDDGRVCYAFVRDESLQSDERLAAIYRFDSIFPIEQSLINGVKFNVPHNPKAELERIYGPNFMIPDPKWRTASKNNKFIEILPLERFYGIRKNSKS